MDLLDVVIERTGIDPEIVFEIRSQYGGTSHYIRSARSDRHIRIRETPLPSRELASRFQVSVRTISNIRKASRA